MNILYSYLSLFDFNVETNYNILSRITLNINIQSSYLIPSLH
jgi:hypothetical protein